MVRSKQHLQFGRFAYNLHLLLLQFDLNPENSADGAVAPVPYARDLGKRDGAAGNPMLRIVPHKKAKGVILSKVS